MLLEIEVMGSSQWFNRVYPEILNIGFEEKAELGWADPETDGELRGYYFDFKGSRRLALEEFQKFFKEMETIIMDGEAPFIKFNIVSNEIREGVK